MMMALFFVVPVPTGDFFHFLFKMAVVEGGVREVILETGDIVIAIIIRLAQEDRERVFWCSRLSGHNDLGILYEVALRSKPLKEHACGFLVVIIIDIQVAVGLYIEVLFYGEGGLEYAVLDKPIGPPISAMSLLTCRWRTSAMRGIPLNRMTIPSPPCVFYKDSIPHIP